MKVMVSFGNNPQELAELPDEVQEAIFFNFAKRDAEETLHFSHLYINKPYAANVLRIAAKIHPEIAAENILQNNDHPKFKALHQFMSQEYGADEAKKYLEKSQQTLNRTRILGVFNAPFTTSIKWGLDLFKRGAKLVKNFRGRIK